MRYCQGSGLTVYVSPQGRDVDVSFHRIGVYGLCVISSIEVDSLCDMSTDLKYRFVCDL